MADYSRYQGPSPEWLEFTKTTHVPAAGPQPGQSIEEYQKVTNAGRERLAALSMGKLGQLSNLEVMPDARTDATKVFERRFGCKTFKSPHVMGRAFPYGCIDPRKY